VAWIDAPVEAVWEAFTTADGWKKFGIARVDVDLRVGRRIRSHYDPKGTLGDPQTIENTILAYEPLRLLALKATKVPEGFPFPKAVVDPTWSTFTFTDLGEGRTRVVIRGHGYSTHPDSQRMRAFFERANAATMEQLAARLGRAPSPEAAALRPIEVTAVLPATPEAVFAAWTTSAGLRAVLGIESRVVLEIGGAYEWVFEPEAAEGSRGSEGCVIQTWIPNRLLAFTWNAPPRFELARTLPTRVVVELEREDAHHTRVWLTHAGFADAAAEAVVADEEFAEVRAYFEKAWPLVLGLFQRHFSPR
jgi:uncharacterized protein YndB with AHSA1/START domain